MATRLDKVLRLLVPGARKASRGTLSGFMSSASPSSGQPLPEGADASGFISPTRMREVLFRTATTAAATNAIFDYAGGVQISLRNIDAAKPVLKKQINSVSRLLSRPNPNQSRRQFLLALMRDMVALGFGAVEIAFNGLGEMELWVLDAARLKIDFDEHGTILGYDMLDSHGVPIVRGDGQHAWRPEEIIFFSLNPMSESIYPYSRITQLFSAAVIEDLMMFFISQRFTDSNIPFGVMDLGDITEQELKVAIANWNAQASENHHILLTGSKSGSKWIPFGYHLKDLEATSLLAEVRMKIMGILGVTMNELGESQDINKSNGYNLSFTFKKRAIEPLLNEIVETLSRRLLWETLGYIALELYYNEIDSRDDLIQAQIDDSYLRMGVYSINDVRNRKGMPNIPGGEVNNVFTGSAWVPVSMLTEMAESLLAAEKQATNAAMTGPDNTNTVRLHVGSSKPQAQGQKPEGAVHATRQVTGQK